MTETAAIQRKAKTHFFVVKIQRPLATNEHPPQALIYDKHRRHTVQVPFSTVASFFHPEELKVYCLAKMVGTVMHILHKTTARGW